MRGGISERSGSAATPATVAKLVRDESEHRCAVCWGPYGKSAIRCKNEPEGQVK